MGKKSKKRIVFEIILTIFFIWCLIGAIVVFPPAIIAVIGIYLLILLIPKNKKEIETVGVKTRQVIDYLGAWAAELGKTGAVLTYHGGVIIKGTTEEFYRLIGGEEGAKKILETLGKVTVEAGKIVVNAGIEAGKVVVALTRYTMDRIDQERARLSADERRLLDEDVEWRVFEDNDKTEFVNFVNMKDD